MEAKALFEYLVLAAVAGGPLSRAVGRLQEKHLQTFQRRLKDWRQENGPGKEVFSPGIRRRARCWRWIGRTASIATR